MNDCVFCNPTVVKSSILENDLAYAIWDKFPKGQGHSLVITKRHVPNFFEATPAERTAVAELAVELKKMLADRFSPEGYNVFTNVNKVSGQEVFHYHLHVLPRYKDDGVKMVGGTWTA